MVGGRWVLRGGQHPGELESARAFARVLHELLG
jgi:formimidoylglutamate deiminase